MATGTTKSYGLERGPLWQRMKYGPVHGRLRMATIRLMFVGHCLTYAWRHFEMDKQYPQH